MGGTDPTLDTEPAQLPNDQLWRAETEELATVGLYSVKELEEWQGKNAISQLQTGHTWCGGLQ